MDEKSDVKAMMAELIDGLAKFEQTHHALSQELKLDLSELVVNGLRNKGWTHKQLADAIKTKDTYINRVVHANQNCTLDVIGRLCHVLNIKPKLIDLSETKVIFNQSISKTATTTGELKLVVNNETPYAKETVRINSTNEATHRYAA